MKKLISLLVVLFAFTLISFSHVENNPTKVESTISVDKAPEFKGDLALYFKKNLDYPEDSRTNKVQGTVLVEFTVNKDGTISNVHVLKGVSKELNKECVDVVENMPEWKPGKVNGVKVKVKYIIPIKFILHS